MKIKNVVVIGSGTMGSGIAAHLCNADVPVTLLDLKTEISENARERRINTLLGRYTSTARCKVPCTLSFQRDIMFLVYKKGHTGL